MRNGILWNRHNRVPQLESNGRWEGWGVILPDRQWRWRRLSLHFQTGKDNGRDIGTFRSLEEIPMNPFVCTEYDLIFERCWSPVPASEKLNSWCRELSRNSRSLSLSVEFRNGIFRTELKVALLIFLYGLYRPKPVRHPLYVLNSTVEQVLWYDLLMPPVKLWLYRFVFVCRCMYITSFRSGW